MEQQRVVLYHYEFLTGYLKEPTLQLDVLSLDWKATLKALMRQKIQRVSIERPKSKYVQRCIGALGLGRHTSIKTQK